MNHKEEVKLTRYFSKLCNMRDIVLCMKEDKGHWDDGTGKDKLAFQVDAEISDVRVIKIGDWSPKYGIKRPDQKYMEKLTDSDLEAMLDEGVAKVKAEKLKAQLKADAALQKKSKIGNMDVFKRVSDFLKKNGYNLTTPKDENEPIYMKVGATTLKWNNMEDFVSAGFEVHGCWEREGYISIFRVISYWSSHYYKLTYQSLRKLVDKVGVLGDVPKYAKLPVTIMRELDNLKV